MSTIARYYDAEKNPKDERFFAQIPLRDLTQEEWDALPDHLKRSADASDLYRKTKPRTEPAKESDD